MLMMAQVCTCPLQFGMNIRAQLFGNSTTGLFWKDRTQAFALLSVTGVLVNIAVVREGAATVPGFVI